MLRSGFILSVSGPAALLALFVQPMVQQAADGWAAPAAIVAPVVGQAPDLRAPARALVQLAAVPQTRPAAAPVQPQAGSASEMQPPVKPRRLMRDGCEGAISSLAGPEARRMVPGRCIA